MSVPLPVRLSLGGSKKNWVRGVPLLGSEVLNLSAWAERGDKILLFPVNVIQTAETLD